MDYEGREERAYTPLWDAVETSSLFDIFLQAAAVAPGKIAAITLDGQLSYGDLIDRAIGWASRFAPHVRRDTTIEPLFCICDDSLVQLPVMLGCWRVGIAHAAIDPEMSLEQLVRHQNIWDA